MDIELKKYIVNQIKSKYKTFDKGHNISHFNFVIRNCKKYGQWLMKQGEKIDLDIAYIVGAFHDYGMIDGRDNHAISSGKYVRQDKMLKKYYSPNIIELIAQAVEDHSSHLSYEPRSIYGKIIADADRNNTKYLVFSRPIKYGLKHNPPNWNKIQHIDEAYRFVNEKFGRNGYVKYWLNIPYTTTEQNAVWELLDNEKMCKSYICGLFDEITKGKF